MGIYFLKIENIYIEIFGFGNKVWYNGIKKFSVISGPGMVSLEELRGSDYSGEYYNAVTIF